PIQFTYPNLSALLRPIGMRSPAGLFWTFMGASPAYVIFSGVAELIAAMLLIFKRTKVLGTAVAVGVLSNVVALNYSYDLGVKLFSSHLLLMAVFLLAPHLRTLADVFVFHKPARIIETDPLELRPRILRIGTRCAKALIFGSFIVNTTAKDWTNYKRY